MTVGWRRLLRSGLLLTVAACTGEDSPDPTGPPVPSSIVVSPSSVSFKALSETQQFTATVMDEAGAVIPGASVTWTSTNHQVATVSAAGLVTALSSGPATITATAGAAVGTGSVSVQQIPSSIALSPTSLELEGPGDSATVIASVQDAGGSEIAGPELTWSSNDEEVVSISDDGLVTAVASGSTSVSVGVTGGVSPLSQSLEVEVETGVMTGAGGGQVVVADGAATLSVPSGALSARAFIVAVQATSLPSGANAIAAFDFGPDGLVFNEPVMLTIEYDPVALPPGVVEEDLRLYHLIGSSFVLVEGSTVDETSHTVSGQISGFSVYAVLQELAITTESLPDGVIGTSYNQALSVSGGSGSYIWSIASGSLPPGLSLSSNGVVSGTPTEAGTSAFSVQVVSSGQTAQRAFSVTVSDLLSATSSVLPSGVVGSAYEAGLSATGGDGNYEWTVVAGELPPGLELNATTGVIAGTPTSPGPSNFTVRATSGLQEAERALSISVYAALEVLTSSLPNGAPETPYEATLQATGGDGTYTWSVSSGSLPGGLSLTASTGVISGIPSASGSTFTIQVESGDGQTDTQVLTIDVSAELAVFTTLLPDGSVGVEYSETLVATGGDGNYEWEVGGGSLPSGLGLAVNGAIAGTPTVGGTSDFTVEVSSGGQTAQRELSIVVHAQLTVTTTSLPDAARGEPFSQNLTATGGNGSYSWTVLSGSLPDGLALSAGGDINGTPTGVGASNFTVEVTDGTQTAQKPLSVFVTGRPATVTDLIVVDQASTTLTVRFTEVDDGLGGPADYALRHAVSPIEWGSADGSQEIVQGTQIGAQRQVVVTGLAPDTQYDVQMVAFRGTPDVDAVYSENLSNVATGTTLVTPVILTTSYLVGGYPNASYSDAIAAATGGDGTYSYSLTDGALPGGLSLNASTGEIEGIATEPGVAFFEITAGNLGLSASAVYSISISTNPASGFNLWIAYEGGAMPGDASQVGISAAVARWEGVLTGEVDDVMLPGAGLTPFSCPLVNAPLLNGGFVDDVVLVLGFGPIDGLDGTLARAGPCGWFRTDAPHALLGQVQVDEADADAPATYVEDIVWHEVAHVMGIGSLWNEFISGSGTNLPQYIGATGNSEWRDLGGPFDGIPVEPEVEAHWDEAWFGIEIMTPRVQGPGVRYPISRMTLGTLQDLGWAVDLSMADDYALPAALEGPSRVSPTIEPFDVVVVGDMMPLPGE